MTKKDYQKPEIRIIGEKQAEPQQQLPAPILPEIGFDLWWNMAQQQYGFTQALKTSIKKHFEARGFMDSKDFEAGLKDFGLRK